MTIKTVNLIIKEAILLLDTPYEYAVKSEKIPTVLDCSSFTQYVFKKITNKDIGRSTIIQASQGKKISKKNIKPGDLIFFRGIQGHYNDKLFPPKKYGYDINIGHVALYIGNKMVIHANGKKKKVVKESLEKVQKNSIKIVIIRRY
ncbi:C40 family peptidase [Patescibacteria group bacterium]|nr:C40 family peptidase [Patescibacteria group bacterium]